MARNCITSLLTAAMLLCTLSIASAQPAPEAQPQTQPQTRGNIGDQIPHGMGGLPDNTPARPQTVLPTPAVHDIPPPRPGKPLDDSEQLKLEKEMAAARSSHKKLADPTLEKRGNEATAASEAALAQARKKAGNPALKTPVKPAAKPEIKPAQ